MRAVLGSLILIAVVLVAIVSLWVTRGGGAAREPRRAHIDALDKRPRDL